LEVAVRTSWFSPRAIPRFATFTTALSRTRKAYLLTLLILTAGSGPPGAQRLAAADRPAGVTRSASGALAVPGLDSLSAATLGRALDYLNLRPAELGFDKLYADDDTFRLAIVEELLNDPLKLPGWQQEVQARIRATQADPAALAALLGELLEAPAPKSATGSASTGAAGAAAAAAASTASTTSTASTASTSAGIPAIAPNAPPGADAEPMRALAPALDAFVRDCARAETALDRAFAHLSDSDRRTVLLLAPLFWGDGEDPLEKLRKGALHREAGVPVDTAGKYTESPILNAAVKMDRPALTEAAVIYLGAVDRLRAASAPILRASAGGSDRPAEDGPGGTALSGVRGNVLGSIPTRWGLLVVGGHGNNEYSAESLARIAFILEPGGDDVYRGRAASAVGGLAPGAAADAGQPGEPPRMRPLSAVIDLDGNDLYDAGERTYALAGAIFGLAALLDESGDDVYRADDGSLGAGFFGAGYLRDGGGRDWFEGRNLCQGSGAFGLGALVTDAPDEPPPGPELETDRSFELGFVPVPGTGARPIRWDDNDVYVCSRQSQGFASTFGVGLLHERVGNDLYRSGGRTLHRPLLPHDFQSLAQGYSIGFRPRAAGGIGILMDDEGNDFYDAEVYAQGVSYWYSIGLLADNGGNDRYLATQYAQGAGVHLSIGSLYDRAGDDHYVCKLGVTQGTAHDLSVGLQLDDAGNDFYIVSDGQGMSITNSTAIFIDAQGDDVYATPGAGQGWITWARGFCGAGIFLDLEGKDTYPAKSAGKEGYGRDGAVWSPDVYALGMDLARDVTLPSEVVPEPVLTAADSAMPIAELYELSNIWEVGSAREKVRRARKALIARGMEAVRFSLAEGLATQDGLVYRNLTEIGRAYPDSFAALLLPRLRDPDIWVQRNTISLLGELKRKEARPRLEAILRDRGQETHYNRVIQALGNIGDPAARPAVRPFLHDAKERRRIGTTVALAALKDTASVPAIAALLADPQLTVRSAASAALGGFPAQAVEALVALGSPEARRSGRLEPARPIDEPLRVRTLGRIAVALKDSTRADLVEARRMARMELMRVLDAAHGRPTSAGAAAGAAGATGTAGAIGAGGATGTSGAGGAAGAAGTAGAAGVAGASVRSAAVEALLALGDPQTREFVRLRLRDESDPLVRRAFERGGGAEKD